MSRLARRLLAQTALLGAVGVMAASPALAAGSAAVTAAGLDASYPQCGKTLPARPAFAIVGINGGLANDLNPCLGPSAAYPSYLKSELYFAVSAATGVTSQPKASLYVNTGDPGDIRNGKPIADWPATGSTPYGACSTVTVTTSSGTFTVGQNSPACAWQYGYSRAVQDAAWLSGAASAINAQKPPVAVSGAPSSYPWWLDVETISSWQSGASGQAMNVADLQGMVAALDAAGARTVGAYSTASQWKSITGGTGPAAGSLYGLADWVPGARSLSGAVSNCRLSSFTGGRVTVTQWLAKSTDYDHAC